jgi:hypothetical protein
MVGRDEFLRRADFSDSAAVQGFGVGLFTACGRTYCTRLSSTTRSPPGGGSTAAGTDRMMLDAARLCHCTCGRRQDRPRDGVRDRRIDGPINVKVSRSTHAARRKIRANTAGHRIGGLLFFAACVANIDCGHSNLRSIEFVFSISGAEGAVILRACLLCY